MANHTRYWIAATGGTYRAFPINQALADWGTYAVAPTEVAGRYAFVLDDAHGTSWLLFAGSSAPASYDEMIAPIELEVSIARLLAQAVYDVRPSGGQLIAGAEEVAAVDAVADSIAAVLPADSQRMAGADDLEAAGAEITSIDPETADFLAARLVKARGEFYPPRSVVWVLQRTANGIRVQGGVELSKSPGEINSRRYVDFAGLLGRNEAVQEIVGITGSGASYIEGDSDGIVGNLVYFAVTGGVDGQQLAFRVRVTTTEDAELVADVLLNVVE